MNLGNYRFADIKDGTKIMEQLKKYETEISQEMVEQVVLVAYERKTE